MAMKRVLLAIPFLFWAPAHTSIQKTPSQKKVTRLIPKTVTFKTTLFKTSELPVLVDVRPDWGVVDRSMISHFQEIAFTLRKKVKCVKMPIESFEESDETVSFLKKQFGQTIECVPTFLLIKNNKVVGKIEGTLSKKAFETKVREFLKL